MQLSSGTREAIREFPENVISCAASEMRRERAKTTGKEGTAAPASPQRVGKGAVSLPAFEYIRRSEKSILRFGGFI